MNYRQLQAVNLPSVDVGFSSEKWNLGDILAFVIPTLIFVEFSLGGRLFLPEVILLCILPIMLMQSGTDLYRPLPTQMLVLSAMWLTSLMLSDFVNNTPFEDWARGWAKIAVFVLNFAALYLLIGGRYRRLWLFGLGLAVGQLLAFEFAPSAYAQEVPWKFGYGPAVTLLAVAIADIRYFAKYRFASVGFLLLLCLLNLYMGSRSAALILFLAGAFVLLKKMRSKNGRAMSPLVMGLVIVAAGTAMNLFYSYAAINGLLGDDEQYKYEEQAYGQGGIILGGRAEFLVSSQAVMDSPILGHGSWARDPIYVDLLADLGRSRGFGTGEAGALADNDFIPSHSFLMGSWVEAGMMGAVFWVWAFLLITRALIKVDEQAGSLVALVGYLGIGLIWAILFSPFGATERLAISFVLVLLVSILEGRQAQVVGRPAT